MPATLHSGQSNGPVSIGPVDPVTVGETPKPPAQPPPIGDAALAREERIPARTSGRLYQPGDIIAQKYCLVRLLGEGGMGAVWLARNLKLEVEVAIKLIRRELATPETAERLLQEARAAARIGHRSIVRVFDFGETELDDPFIVMEVLTGESLRTLLERKGRRLAATNAVRTLLPIASALCDAHAAGIVHRDLKPENIMLVPDTSGGVVPKIVDFGIAKLRRGGGEEDDARSPMFVAGTPDYMSPEQAGGREAVEEAADVWALAVILYESITGQVPFGGPTYAALIFAIMTVEPTPTTDQLAGDAELWAILQEALAKRASDRPTMRAFGTALARWAIAAGADSDVAGTSIAAHWLHGTTQGPYSGLPPPLADGEAAFDPEMPLPRPGSLPALRVGTDRAPGKDDPTPPLPTLVTSPPRPARSMSAAWIGVAGVVVAAAILVVGRRGASPAPLPPSAAPGALVAASAAPPVPVTASAPVETPTASTATSAAVPAASVEPSESAAPAGSALPPPHWAPKPLPPRLPRKSTLPIAKQPNF